ncbi:RNA-directed DNA polymerase, eukaryota, reverse transcriptase zinc-binding domain protein [Tanacetum coccineum]
MRAATGYYATTSVSPPATIRQQQRQQATMRTFSASRLLLANSGRSDLIYMLGLNVRGVGVGCYSTSNRFGRYGAANDKVNHESTNIDLLSMCSRKIGNGVHTRFWEDIWCGDQPFRLRFPRIFLLEIDRECLVANQIHLSDWSSVLRRALRGGAESSQFDSLLAAIGDVDLSDQRDSWKWSLHASVGFSVASVRLLVDEHTLEADNVATRWNKCIPIKVNIFLWRLGLNKLPSKINLQRKGIDVGSVLCPICQDDVESVNHLFFNCDMAKHLWDLLAKWWDLDIPVCANILEWYSWLDSLRDSTKVRTFLEGVGGTLLWSIWSFRNRLVFSSPPPKKALLWDSVLSQSYLWISSRNPKSKFSWIGWLHNPVIFIDSM